MNTFRMELEWRRRVMGDVKDALACGDGARAYEILTRHEHEGYPWAPDAPSNRGPYAAHAFVDDAPVTPGSVPGPTHTKEEG